MGQWIHKLHEFIIVTFKYLLIFAVIGLIPIPLSSLIQGDILHEQNYNPLFQYFNHYNINNQQINNHLFTNVYINEIEQKVNQFDVDNAILWADYLAYQLIEAQIPIVRKIISTNTANFQSVKALHQQSKIVGFIDQQIQKYVSDIKQKLQQFVPINYFTEESRQWIILALNSNEKDVKKAVKRYVKNNPNDKFLIISQNPLDSLGQSSKIKLPSFEKQQAQKILTQQMAITQTQANIILSFANKSLLRVDKMNNGNKQLTIKSLLGQFYYPLNNIAQKQELLLQQICQKNKIKANKKIKLGKYGIETKKKHFLWQNNMSKLNYQLAKQSFCKIQVLEIKKPQINQQQQNKVDDLIIIEQKNIENHKIQAQYQTKYIQNAAQSL